MSDETVTRADVATDLDAVLASLWSKLRAAAERASDPWHLPTLATVRDGEPRLRTVVLRGVDERRGVLRFHTDRRSPKVAEMRTSPRIAWAFYDPERRTQLRAVGRATVLTEGPAFEQAWGESPLRSRKCYLAPRPPSEESAVPTPNLPESLLDRDPTPDESEAGKPNFAVVLCEVDRFDWLRIRHDGHLRATFERDAGTWRGRWAAP